MASEKRLIDAKPFMKAGWHLVRTGKSNEYLASLSLADVPTVDAVEVVRCKDCKHWHEATGWCDQHSWFIEEDGEPCHPWESNNWKMLNEDDFCSYGERKDNETL